MENLIKELEKVAESNDKMADEFSESNSFIASVNAKGFASGLRFAINLLKLQIALTGEKKWKT